MGSIGFQIGTGRTVAQILPILQNEVGQNFPIISHRRGSYSWAQGDKTAPEGYENFIIGILWEYSPKVGYLTIKTIGEDMGPSNLTCPLWALDKPVTFENSYSKDWRAAVRAYWAKKESKKALVIAPGMWVAMEDGREFRILAKINRAYLVSDREGRRYRLRPCLIDRVVPGPEDIKVGVAS